MFTMHWLDPALVRRGEERVASRDSQLVRVRPTEGVESLVGMRT